MNLLKRWPKAALAVALAAALALQFFSGRMNPYDRDVMITVGINVILAVSLNLINGYAGQFSLGHAGFMAVGAYSAAAVTMFIGPKILPAETSPLAGVAANLLFVAALLLGGLAAAFAGIIVGAPSLRLKGDYLAIVTLGFGEIIRVVVRNIEPLGGALGLNGIPPYTTVFWVFATVAVCTYVVLAMAHSTYGRGFIAVRDDEVAAEAMGLNTTRYKIAAFVVGSFFAGVAGGLYGHYTLSIEPKGFDFNRSIEIVVMVIVGGMGNTAGVIAAAILLTVMQEYLRAFAEYRMILYSSLLIILMLTRPQGLFSWRRKTAAAPSA